MLIKASLNNTLRSFFHNLYFPILNLKTIYNTDSKLKEFVSKLRFIRDCLKPSPF